MIEDESLTRFCEEQYPRLVRWLGMYCGDVHVAEEIAQDTLVVVCSKWAAVRQTSSPVAWAHRVATNRAHSYFRRRSAAHRALRRLEGQADVTHRDTYSIPDAVLVEALARLPPRQRIALLLRYAADLSVHEVSVAMDTSDQSVRNLAHRATARLRKQLDSHTREAAR